MTSAKARWDAWWAESDMFWRLFFAHKHRSTKCQLFANRKLSNALNFKRHTFMLMRFKSFLITFAGDPEPPTKKTATTARSFRPPI